MGFSGGCCNCSEFGPGWWWMGWWMAVGRRCGAGLMAGMMMGSEWKLGRYDGVAMMGPP